MPSRILIIDDDARLFELLSQYLVENGFEATHAGNGAVGLSELERNAYEAVLLDIMMPGMDGLEVLRRIRTKNRIPVIMLTAKGDETDRVVGLELGADDYLPKPFGPRELLARLRAVLRRAQGNVESERLEAAGISIDLAERRVLVGDEPVELTGLEFDLLVALVRRAGRVVPRSQLLDLAGRGDVTVSERAVDVHISHLRKKLGDDSSEPTLIKTVRGLGYVFARERA